MAKRTFIQSNNNWTNESHPRRTKLRLYDKFWTREYVAGRPNCLFVFGDNDAHQGRGGQAVIRGLPNAIGIPTKKYPNNRPSSFYTDDEYDINTAKIDTAIEEILAAAPTYRYVVLPYAGIGTGLADLPRRAPYTFDYLCLSLLQMRNRI